MLIGSMLVAPLMPPLGLCIFGFCGGRLKWAGQGLGTAMLGIATATLAAMATAHVIAVAGIAGPEENAIFIGRRCSKSVCVQAGTR